MADWYGNARSNYFRVKDEEAFRKALEGVDVAIHTHEEDGRVWLISEDEYGGWPSFVGDDESYDDPAEFDIGSVISKHLAPGEVAVLIEIGAEKMRYLTGRAVAVNERNEIEVVDLEEIYERAQRLGENITVASF